MWSRLTGSSGASQSPKDDDARRRRTTTTSDSTRSKRDRDRDPDTRSVVSSTSTRKPSLSRRDTAPSSTASFTTAFDDIPRSRAAPNTDPNSDYDRRRDDRRSSYAESSTSTMRDDRDKKKRSKDSESDKRRSTRSEQPSSVTQTGGYRGDIVDSPKSLQRSYSEQMGSDGLSRFPGQAGAPMMSGALPVGTNGPQLSSSSQYQNQPQQQQQGHYYSDHVQSQFPGQDPVNFASSALPGGNPFGAAAEFYNDQGQSVGQQPGVRPQPPSVIVGQDTPHLMSASAQPNPVADTGSGAAADFYTQGPSTPSSRPPRPLSSSMPGAFVDDTPAPPKPPRPASSLRPDKPGTFGTAASMASAAAFGYAAGHSSSSHEHSASFSSSSNVRPPSSFSSYTNTAPAAPASTYNMYGNGPNTSNSNASNGTHLPSYAAAAHGNDDIPPPKPPRPSKPEKHSSSSNAGLLAAGAAGLAAYATHQHNSSTHEHSHSHTHTHSHSHGTSQHHSASGAPNGHQNNGLLPSAYVSGGMAQHHQHTGPVSRFVDWWKDYEDVQKMEEYTEYIGVCKGCFDPRSSVLDAPRKHHYYKRRSNEFMRPSGGIEKQSRYNLKEKRSQNSISGEERRKTSNSAAGWMAAGLGGLGLAKAGKAVWNTARDDFDDTYSIKSGRSRVSRRSSSRSLDRKGYSYGYAGVRHRSRSGDRMSNMSVGVTGDRKDRRAHKSRRHSRASSSSSSSSDNGKSGLIGAAIGAGLAGAALGASASKKRHARSKSPKRVQVVHPRRDSNDDERSRRSQQLRHKVSRSSTSGASVIEIGQNHEHEGGFFQGFFAAPPPKEKRVKPASLKKKKGGFFNFTNASTSSTDSDMAFGTGYVRRRRRSSHSRRPSPKRRNSDERLKASLIGLGATAAAITAAKAGKGKRSRDVSVAKENRKSLRDSQSSRTGSRYGDDEWEDLPDDGPSDSASDGGLVYGEHVLRKSKSNESMESNGSGTNKWGWRWGFGKKKRRSSNNLYDNIASTSLIAPAAAGAVGAATGAAAIGATQGRPDSQSSSAQTLQSVYPVAPHDPNAFFDARRTSSIATSQPLVTSGPGSVSLQQPQPMHQVHGTVYTTQAPPPASYNAPTGPPVFSQVPPQPQAQNITINNNNNNNQFPQQPPLRRANSSPIQTSSWRRDAAIAGLAATAGAAAISALKSDRPPSASSNVRFDLTQAQTEKEMRERRRQQERIEEEAQRRREQQRLDDEARWEEEELARREQQRRDDQARRLETARREEEERVRREQQRQEDEARKAEEERRLALLRLEESKREEEERRLTLLRQEETRREEERRLILLRQEETKREEEERRLTLLRQEETRREEEERRLALLRQEETKREEDERRRRELQRQQDEARKFMEIERLARLENDRRRDEHELAARQLREAEERERQQRLAFLEHQRQLAIEAAEEERVRRERREAQQQEAERIDAARREAEIQEDLEQRRRGRELQDPSNRYASVQARQLEEQPTADSIASTGTVVQRKEKEPKDREREPLKPEKKSFSVASAVAAGAAAAIVGGAISSYKDKTKEKEKEKKEKERDRKRDRSLKRQSSSSSKSSESKRGKTREPASVKTIEPSRVEQDMFDEDIFNPDLFKEPARQDAREVLRDWEDRYSAKPVSQAEFFAPRELLADDNLPKVKPVDPNEGVGDLQMYYAHEDAPSGQPILPPYPPSYSFTATRDGRPTKQQPLPIPVLSLTMPTPPGSRAPSVRSVSPSPARTREPIRDTTDDYRQEDSNRARSRVSWGENQFHHFDVPTPESFREQFVSDGDLKRQQPNYSTDQVTVEREAPTSAYIPYQPGTPSSSESKETTPSTQYVSDDNSSTWDSVVSASASSKASERNENTPSNSASGSAVSNVSAPPPQSQQDEYDYKRINSSLLSNPFSDTNMAPSTIAASLISAPSAISAPSIISAAPSTSSVQTAYYQPEPAFDMRMIPDRRTTGPGFVEGEIPDDPVPLHIPGSFEEAEESEPPTPTMESFASAARKDTKGKTSKSTDSNVVLQDIPRQVEPEPPVVSKSSKGKGVESDTKSSKKEKDKDKDKEKKKKKKSSKSSKRISVDTWELDEPSPPTSPILERDPRDIEPSRTIESPRTVEPSRSGESSRTADRGQDYQPSKSASRSDEGSSAKVSPAALAGGFAALIGTAISQDQDRMASDFERAKRNLESAEKPPARDSHSSSANNNRAPEDPAKNVTIPSYAFEGVDELADKTPKRRSEKRSSSSGKWSPSVGSPLRTEMKQEDYMGARNNSDGSKYQPLVEAPKVPTAAPFTSASDPTTSRSVADSGYYAPDDFTHPESNEKESDKSYFASSNGNARDSQSRASNAERSRRSDDEDDYRRRNSFDDDIGSIASLSYKYEDPDREERRRRRREARSETRDKSRDKSRDRDYDVGEGEERRRKHRRRETDEGADDWDTRSTYSEARSDVNGERRRRHKRKDSSPDRKTRSRSEAASEYGDLYDEPKSSRRRSRREDDDTASLISSFAGWDDDRSSRKEKDKRSSGLMGLFSSKSRENLAEAASKSSRSRDDDDEERKHRRRRHRSDRGSTYGSDDDDVRSTISSTSRREKRSRSSRSERDGDRADAYDEKVHRSSYMR